MAKSFVLLTAMPPTTGHLQLIQFAHNLCDEHVHVILCTQPSEPFPQQRADALRTALARLRIKYVFTHIDQEMEQDPDAPGFWDTWRTIVQDAGATASDYVVASELYGARVASLVGATFYPYDIDRELNPTKATAIRDNPIKYFMNIVSEFQPLLRTRITVFGAESTGKTTLSKQLATRLNGQWLFEYARPYLERTTNEITKRSMTAIWKGQAALQSQTELCVGKPYVIQDTDLYSTVGYWEFPHWRPMIGECPAGLITAARHLRSDLYIVTRSNIPYEQDPLRYGGDHREGSDEYWIAICKEYHLPYVVLDAVGQLERLEEAVRYAKEMSLTKTNAIAYDRHGL